MRINELTRVRLVTNEIAVTGSRHDGVDRRLREEGSSGTGGSWRLSCGRLSCGRLSCGRLGSGRLGSRKMSGWRLESNFL